MSFFDVWVKWKDKAIWSFRQRGIAGTLKLALALSKEGLSCRWQHYRDKLFDWRFAVDTVGVLVLPELQSDPRFKYCSADARLPRSVDMPLATISVDNAVVVLQTPYMHSGTYRVLLAACLLILLAGGAAHIFFGNSDWENTLGVDDAYISYRYAHNLFRGNGLVFNPGERVEGYSNFLYTLLMSLAFFLTQGVGVYYFSAFLNLLFAGATLVVFAGFLRERLGNGLAAVGALLFALCLPVWAAVGSGMETCLILLIYISIWVVTERLAQEANRRWTTLLCALGVLSLLSRADGFLVPGAAIVYLLLKLRTRAALTCAATLGASGFVYEVWRYQYYGYLLPNTYYIRVVGPFLWRAHFALRQLQGIATRGGLLPYLLVFLFLAVELARKWLRN